MKVKIIALLLSFCILSACTTDTVKSNSSKTGEYSGKATAGVWISYSEINSMLTSEFGFEAEVEKAIENCKTLKIENAYIHVRAFCDSLYPSEYFPLLEGAQNYNYDVFEFLLNEFHNKDIKVHAWINPYRVYTASENIDDLKTGSPAYKWLKDEISENDKNVCFANGIYLNPAEAEVQQLVIDGIREIISKYDVDGIHFDDYFYPTQDEEFDSVSYENYKNETQKPLSLEDWRRANVNVLISGCYAAIKSFKKDVVFSISPAASIKNNYDSLYADVEYWIANGYIDCIIPQLYFGFDYPLDEFEFENLLKDWKKIAQKNKDVSLFIGLATYKIGTDTEPDCDEWQNSDDIIARQVKLCTDDDRISGYVYFSYSSLVSEAESNSKQRAAIIEYIS